MVKNEFGVVAVEAEGGAHGCAHKGPAARARAARVVHALQDDLDLVTGVDVQAVVCVEAVAEGAEMNAAVREAQLEEACSAAAARRARVAHRCARRKERALKDGEASRELRAHARVVSAMER